MSRVIYEVVEHDGGWAYRAGGVYSETFSTHDLARQAAVLARGIAETQPFIDGNQRTGLVAMLTFLGTQRFLSRRATPNSRTGSSASAGGQRLKSSPPNCGRGCEPPETHRQFDRESSSWTSRLPRRGARTRLGSCEPIPAPIGRALIPKCPVSLRDPPAVAESAYAHVQTQGSGVAEGPHERANPPPLCFGEPGRLEVDQGEDLPHPRARRATLVAHGAEDRRRDHAPG